MESLIYFYLVSILVIFDTVSPVKTSYSYISSVPIKPNIETYKFERVIINRSQIDLEFTTIHRGLGADIEAEWVEG